MKLFGQATIDDKLIFLLAGYIATGSDLSEIENIPLTMDNDVLAASLHGENIMITTNDQ